MKRDMDLIRRILMDIEESPEATGYQWLDLSIEGHSPEEVSYHVKLLDEAGLIEAEDLTDTAGFDVRPKRLTWSGHEFIDAVRKDTARE
jgi:DNA-binding transcriptional ArsR family regulator